MFSHLVFFVVFTSVRLRKKSSIKRSDNVNDIKKGQRLIENETMETGNVRS